MLRYISTIFGLKEDNNGDLIKYSHYVNLSLKYDKLLKQYEKLESAHVILDAKIYEVELMERDIQNYEDKLMHCYEEKKMIIQKYNQYNITDISLSCVFIILSYVLGFYATSIIDFL